MTAIEAPSASVRATGIRVVAVCTLASAVSQFYRNAHVVVAPDIMRDTGVTAQTLGYLSGALFISSALLQIPAGILIDRYGPRRTLPIMLAAVVIGSTLFAIAQDAVTLIASRAVMGIGVAAIGMACIVASTRWFSSAYFATVVGVVLGLSYFGNMAATVPMALVSEQIGWRQTFIAVSVITAVIAAANALLIRDAPEGHAFHSRQKETLRAAWVGVREILAVRALWPLLGIAGTAYAVVSCILGLWAGPYLFDIYGLDGTARGAIIIWFPIGMLIGNFVITPLDRILDTRKRLIMAGALGTVALFVLLAIEPKLPLLMLTAVFFLMGMLTSYTTVIIAHGRAFYPDRLIGRGATIVNTAVIAGAGLMQASTGAMVGVLAPGATSLSLDMYRLIFFVLAAVLLVATYFYRLCPDMPPSRASQAIG